VVWHSVAAERRLLKPGGRRTLLVDDRSALLQLQAVFNQLSEWHDQHTLLLVVPAAGPRQRQMMRQMASAVKCREGSAAGREPWRSIRTAL